MKPLPASVLALLEPALFALRQGTPNDVKAVLSDVDAARRAVQAPSPLDHLSFELGALESLREFLNTAWHRAAMNSVVDGVRAAQRGLDVLRAAARAQMACKKISQKALAAEIGMNEGNLSRLAKRLAELGAVEVVREGQSSYLRPTAIGEAALDELLAGWRAALPIADEALLQVHLTEPFAVNARPFAGAPYRQLGTVFRGSSGSVTNADWRGAELFEQTDTASAA